MYFVLEADREHALMASFEDSNPGHDLKWMMGRLMELDEKPSNLQVTVDEVRSQYPDFFIEIPATFCSQRLRHKLEGAGADNIEYYPVNMVERSGKRIDGYFAMNIVGRVECMDRERSVFTEWRTRVSRIQSLALNGAAIKGLKVCRPHEYPEIILVSADVAEALHGLPGVSIRSAEGWSDAHRF